MLIKVHELRSAEGTIVDIRTKAEHDNLRLCCDHVFLPMDEIDIAAFVQEHEGPIHILCHSGGRAGQLAEILIGAGLPDTKVIEGGITACESCMPLEGTRLMNSDEIHNYARQSFGLFMHRNKLAS